MESTITIEPLSNGFLIHFDGFTVASASVTEAVSIVERHMKDPANSARHLRDHAVNPECLPATKEQIEEKQKEVHEEEKARFRRSLTRKREWGERSAVVTGRAGMRLGGVHGGIDEYQSIAPTKDTREDLDPMALAYEQGVEDGAKGRPGRAMANAVAS